MNQQFTVKELKKFYRKSDERNFEVLDLNVLENIENHIYDETFQFDEFNFINKYINLMKVDIHKLLVLRKLNYNIKKLYKVKQADRTSIINQVKILSQETSRDIFITRLDIQSFYHSIDKTLILEKILKNDYLLSYHSKFLLEKLFFEHN